MVEKTNGDQNQQQALFHAFVYQFFTYIYHVNAFLVHQSYDQVLVTKEALEIEKSLFAQRDREKLLHNHDIKPIQRRCKSLTRISLSCTFIPYLILMPHMQDIFQHSGTNHACKIMLKACNQKKRRPSMRKKSLSDQPRRLPTNHTR